MTAQNSSISKHGSQLLPQLASCYLAMVTLANITLFSVVKQNVYHSQDFDVCNVLSLECFESVDKQFLPLPLKVLIPLLWARHVQCSSAPACSPSGLCSISASMRDGQCSRSLVSDWLQIDCPENPLMNIQSLYYFKNW